MALVDYSSDSSSADSPPPAKRAKVVSSTPSSLSSTTATATTTTTTTTTRNTKPTTTPTLAKPPGSLPALPAAFHDLYASTVKTFNDPSLHQGRRRQTPHVAGQWPSHLYVEWRPPDATHALLASFLAALQRRLLSEYHHLSPESDAETEVITSLLASDLGIPQPLHVSLSRPVVLATATKDAFLDRVQDRVRRAGVPPFALTCRGGVEWHRTPESERSFLVLRVVSSSSSSSSSSAVERDKAGKEDTSRGNSNSNSNPSPNPNPELTALLEACNGAVRAFGQPELYQWAAAATGQNGDRNRNHDRAVVGEAFHISIAWSPAEPTEELRRATEEVFAGEKGLGLGDRIRGVRIDVGGVKAKIGNVVTNIPLPEPGKGGARAQTAAYLCG